MVASQRKTEQQPVNQQMNQLSDTSNTNRTAETTGEVQNDGKRQKSQTGQSSGSSGEMKRVNFTIHPDQHNQIQDLADERGTTVSALIRQSVRLLSRRDQNEGVSRELQPLLRHVKDNQKEIEAVKSRFDEIRERLDKLAESVEEGTASSGLSTSEQERIAQQLHKHLRKKGPMSIPELVDKTEFSRKEVQLGINQLRNSHTIAEHDGTENQNVVKWEVR